jgi:glutamate-1-semialdehyde 2,1-aminomutase
VCRQHSFFSSHDWFIVTTPMSAGSPAAERLTVQFSYNDLASVAGLFERYPGQIAAAVLEAEP